MKLVFVVDGIVVVEDTVDFLVVVADYVAVEVLVVFLSVLVVVVVVIVAVAVVVVVVVVDLDIVVARCFHVWMDLFFQAYEDSVDFVDFVDSYVLHFYLFSLF